MGPPTPPEPSVGRAAAGHEGPKYDQALKRLLTRAHDGLLALLAPGVIWRGERSPELPATARQADLVWEIETSEGQRGLLHIELQTEPDRRMGARLADYRMRLCERERDDALAIDSIVIYLRPTAAVARPPFVVPSWRGRPLTCDFEVVSLWELPPERVLDTSFYDLWPLASLMGSPSVEQAAAIGERIATAPLPQEERSELAGLLVVLLELRLRRREVLAALRRNPMLDEIVRNSSLAEEFFNEGKAEGKAEGIRISIRVLLERRFPRQVDQATLEALARIEGVELEALLLLSAMGTLAEVRAHLAA